MSKTAQRDQVTRESPGRRLKSMSDTKYELTLLVLKDVYDLQTDFVSSSVVNDLQEKTSRSYICEG
jgi:hypothetical protein